MSARPLSAERSSERFVARRRLRRRRILIASCILFTLLLAGVIYELHQPFARISHVQVFGADQSLSTIAFAAMQGSYLGIIPRDSTFFFPESRIRADILATSSDFAAVSLFRDGLDGLSIRIDSRASVGKWCGLAPTPGVAEYCYLFDASGLVYAAADASTTTAINSATLYAPLVGNAQEPLRATIAEADKLPSIFDFARQLGSLGSPVTQVVLHDGEIDDYLASGSRVTYVLGNDQDAWTALVSAKQNFNLADGSIDYIDLRFDGKVYVKKKSN